ncbi:MAG TPA: hypothetical protein VMT70_08240 [Vicinamibacteria bacterium]|nr:hypothetical protein [Vicinamibacteria bacterium]
MTTASSCPEAEYYQAVEEFFVSRRGDPLFLSNAEWNLVRKWRLAGLPLRIVLRGIRDALDAHDHGWSRDRKVRSLAYCAREVDAARERWERALALGREEGLDVAGALRGFAQDLERAEGLGPRARPAAIEISRELRERAEGGRLEEVSAWMADREARLLESISADEGRERQEALEAEVDRGLERWRARMPRRVLEQLRSELVARRRLEAHGLPRLSLFHLEGGGGA